MISASNLRFTDDAGAHETEPSIPVGAVPEAKVFVRAISTQPAWPWDQRRTAELEARHGSPLPLSDVLYQLHRLDAWRPGAACRFAAFYVLAREVQGRLDATTELDGKSYTVTFSASPERRRLSPAFLRSLAIATAALLIVWSIGAALGRRAEATAALELAEQSVAVKLRRLEARQAEAVQTRALQAELRREIRLRRAIADLAWAASLKTSDARITTLYWDRGFMAVEARSEASPFVATGDQPKRSKRPARPGVWLWAVPNEPGTSPDQPAPRQP